MLLPQKFCSSRVSIYEISVDAEGGSKISKIDDIGDAAKDYGSSEEEILVLQNVTVVGVPYLGSYKACLWCKARVELLTPPLGKCSKVDCQMMQRYDVCAEQSTAKVMLMYKAEG